MLKLNEIKDLIKLIDKSSVEEFEIESEGTRVYIRKPGPAGEGAGQQTAVHTNYVPVPAHPQAQPQVQAAPAPDLTADQQKPAAADETLHHITSPMVGTFYAAPSPGAEAYVRKGDQISEDTVVCIVEAMKLMNEIEAEVKGVIVDVLVENGQLVEFGQPLFSVKLDS